MKSVFLADTGNILTSGFSRNGTRDLALWDSVSIHRSSYLLYSASRLVKSVFLADTGNILTTGFSRNGTKEVALWDSVSTPRSAYL